MLTVKSGMLGAVAMGAALFGAGQASAAVITKTVTLRVYQVCETNGTNCAARGATAGDDFFAAETNKIWAQAGISVLYDFIGTINNSNFTNIDDSVSGRTFGDLAATTGNYQSTTVIDMFLVHTVAGNYGEGWLGAGGLVMGMDTILGFSPEGRIDTMAHELGHNLGLDPAFDPEASSSDPGHSSNPNELMAGGGVRSIPQSLSDIAPDGLGYDQLSTLQIGVARRSSLLSNVSDVPEPASWLMMISGFGAIGIGLRRRNAITGVTFSA